MKKRKNRIIAYEIENIGKIRIMKINLNDRPITVISGKNDVGKTTAIDALGMILNVKSIPEDPIRHGQVKSVVKGYLTTEKYGELTASRKIYKREDGSIGNSLVITDENGKIKDPPVSLFKTLLGENTYNPLEFMMTDKKPQEKRIEQTKLLKKIIGIEDDLQKLEDDRVRTFAERTIANSKVDELGIKLKKYKELKEVQEVNVQDILKSLSKAEEVNKYNASMQEQLKTDEVAILSKRDLIHQKQQRVNEIQKEIERLMQEKLKLETEIKQDTKDGLALRDRILVNKKKIETLPKSIDVSVYHEQIALASETNKQAEMWKQKAELDAEYKVAKDLQFEKNNKLKELDNTKALLLQDAKFPIEGLAFTEAGVTYNGILLDQLGDSQQFKVCLAIMSKVNPDMPVVRIDRWESFDSNFKKMIEEELVKHDLQAIVSMVSEGNVGIVLEETGDGSEVVFDEYGDTK